MIYIDTRSSVPIYEQLYGAVSKLTLVGAYAPHDKLPSVRQLAKDFGINPNTVSKAYAMLEADGLTYAVPGKGIFVAEGAQANQKLKNELLAQFESLTTECHHVLIPKETLLALLGKIYDKGEKIYDSI